MKNTLRRNAVRRTLALLCTLVLLSLCITGCGHQHSFEPMQPESGGTYTVCADGTCRSLEYTVYSCAECGMTSGRNAHSSGHIHVISYDAPEMNAGDTYYITGKCQTCGEQVYFNAKDGVHIDGQEVSPDVLSDIREMVNE